MIQKIGKDLVFPTNRSPIILDLRWSVPVSRVTWPMILAVWITTYSPLERPQQSHRPRFRSRPLLRCLQRLHQQLFLLHYTSISHLRSWPQFHVHRWILVFFLLMCLRVFLCHLLPRWRISNNCWNPSTPHFNVLQTSSRISLNNEQRNLRLTSRQRWNFW